MKTKEKIDSAAHFNQMRAERIQALLQSVKENQRAIVEANQNIVRLEKILVEYAD